MSGEPSPPATAEGDQVRLRPVSVEDCRALLDWYNDPERVSPFDRFAVDTLEGLEAEVRAAPGDPGSLAPRYIVERRSDGRLLGVVGHYAAHPILALTDIWYVIGLPSERGKGYAGEAVRLLTSLLFSDPARVRLGATCDVENVASVRLLERAGYTREGTLRSALFHHSRWHDVHVYGVTRSEWRARSAPR